MMSLSIAGIICGALFVISIYVNYQYEFAKEHVRFRNGFPSQSAWMTSPSGTLNCYLFNVTNSEAFLNGSETKLNLQEIGPIVYKVKGRNHILNVDHTDSTLTYEKFRYYEVEFDAQASCAPDILHQSIISPNLILLSAAAKLHDWVFLVRQAFNAITVNEPVFIHQTVNYFLWNYSTPALDMLADYVPNIVSNCGMLYNALRKKDEVYNVNIGLQHGVENFFRVNFLNNKTYFAEQSTRLKTLSDKSCKFCCPVEVKNSFDNSLFPPFLKPADQISIIAPEVCRIFDLKFDRKEYHLGVPGYLYTINDEANLTTCLGNAMGIKLHNGMFDVSKCLFNDAPAAFSAPHFYKSSYDWSQHFDGFKPDPQYHEAYIIIQPTTGIPIEEKYRFQSNVPMPDLTGYADGIKRFSHMVLPSFWYEYDLDDLPLHVIILMKLNIFVMPILQPILMMILLLLTVIFITNTFMKAKEVNLKRFLIGLLKKKN